MSSLPSDAPAPRLCIIAKWPDFEGYGFNLHAEKSKPGQYIGKVDKHSPAEAAGLLEDDRIIEVNSVNIANENHKQVVQRIKMVANETRLLVVDPQTDKYYKGKNIVVRGTQDNVIVRSSTREQHAPPTPEAKTQAAPAVSNGHHDEIDNRSVSSAASSAASETSTQPQHAAALAEAEKEDTSVEEVLSNDSMEKSKSRSPSPPPVEEAEKPLETNLAPGDEEDGASLSGSDKTSEKDVNASVEDSLPEASERDAPLGEESLEGKEQTLPEAETLKEEDIKQQEEEEEEEKEEEEEMKEKDEEDNEVESPRSPSPDQESDLMGDYDNVEIGGVRAEAAATQATSDSRRLSTSSGSSHSSQPTDPTRTGPPPTQSPMSTSPTPPPSLEPAPEPARSSPNYTKSTTTTTTTNNTSPKSTTVSNNNAYNSSGLNLNMSAAEMRAMLARKKKADPRRDTVDLKTKYEIIQNM